VIEFHKFKGETADMYIMDVLDKYKVSNKIIAFVGITVTQILEELQKKKRNKQCVCQPNDLLLKNENSWHRTYCPHFAQSLRTSADILPVDVEAIVDKIFHYFHIYIVRVEEIKEFCDFVDTEYKQVLGSVKTRWLSLKPVITRVIDMFLGLKSYFLSQKKCPMILKIFFNYPVSTV
jgi:hypothetical protein